MKNLTPICPYCNKSSVLVDGSVVYPHRKDLRRLKFYSCQSCGAFVGCHPNSTKPLGSLANEQLRKIRRKAHSVFDPIWRYGKMSRTKAYQWLANKLKINVKDCHIGMFDENLCHRTIEACRIYTLTGE